MVKNREDYALVMRKKSIFVFFIIGHFYVPVPKTNFFTMPLSIYIFDYFKLAPKT